MVFASKQIKAIASLFAKKKINEKFHYDVGVHIHELEAIIDDESGLAKVHISTDLDMPKDEFYSMLKRLGTA